MNLLVGSIAMGLLLSLLTLGVFVAYRVLGTLDLTADGSFGLGAATAGAMLIHGVDPITSTLIAAMAGAAAGSATGLATTRLGVNVLLAGILTTTALYSINMYIMGGGDISLASARTVSGLAEGWWIKLGAPAGGITLLGTRVNVSNVSALCLFLVLAAGAAYLLLRFLRTSFGLAMRAAGENPQMARALAIDVDAMVLRDLALANGLIAACGALFAQYQGFVNAQMGLGMLVTGLACLMLGEAVLGQQTLVRRIAGVLVGSVLFRMMIAGALRAGLNATALKLVTAVFVLAVLVIPGMLSRQQPPARGAARG